MTDFAIGLLEKLLHDAEKGKAGVRKRVAAITQSALQPYHSSRSINYREAFEALMQAAHDNGAIHLTREHGYGFEGLIERIDLADVGKLASFLGVQTRETQLIKAKATLADYLEYFRVLNDVLERWRLLKSVRGTHPDDVQDWVDAARVILYMRNHSEISKGELPIREVSARLFKDSKVIENITRLLDVLLCDTIDARSRDPYETWSEIGLCRVEQPVRLAGNIILRRERVCALLDIPYAAFPASTVCCVESPLTAILSIENQTTFHSEAKRHYDENVLLIYTAGVPSPAWKAMYTRILQSVPQSTSIEHWGDVDEGGFRIAAMIAEIAKTCGHTLKPHRMSPEDVPLDKRRLATEKTRNRMRQYAERAGWVGLANMIFEAGFTVEQEAL